MYTHLPFFHHGSHQTKSAQERRRWASTPTTAAAERSPTITHGTTTCSCSTRDAILTSHCRLCTCMYRIDAGTAESWRLTTHTLCTHPSSTSTTVHSSIYTSTCTSAFTARVRLLAQLVLHPTHIIHHPATIQPNTCLQPSLTLYSVFPVSRCECGTRMCWLPCESASRLLRDYRHDWSRRLAL